MEISFSPENSIDSSKQRSEARTFKLFVPPPHHTQTPAARQQAFPPLSTSSLTKRETPHTEARDTPGDASPSKEQTRRGIGGHAQNDLRPSCYK